MKLDGLMTYKNWLRTIEENKRKLPYLEGGSTIQGATNIEQLMSLGQEIQEHIKDAMAFVKDPFEPATFDNMMKSGARVGSAYQVAVYEPSEMKFGARDVLDLVKLNELVEIVFKCVVAVKSIQGLSLPNPLMNLDIILCEVIGRAANTLNPSVEFDPNMSITGKVSLSAKPLITYTLLDKQIYFTDEEIEARERAEETANKARQDAIKRAEFKEKIEDYRKKISEIFKDRQTMIDQIFSKITDDNEIAAIYTVVSLYLKDIDPAVYPDGYDFVVNGETPNSYFAIASDLLSTDDCPIFFTNLDSYTAIDDRGDESCLPSGTIVRIGSN